jgi:hypothetical protein
VDERRREVLEAARGIRFDADLGDWRGIPSVLSADVLGPLPPAPDILEAAIAPTSTAVLAMVRTGPGIRKPGTRVWLELDRTTAPGFESLVEIEWGGGVSVWETPAGAKEKSRRKIDVTIASRFEGLEISIPAAALAPPAGAVGDPAPAEKPFVRMCTFLADSRRKILQRGPCIASFVLDRPVEPAPVAGAPAEDAPCRIPPPVLGRWFVSQGPFGSWSHEGEWAYDLGMRDVRHQPSKEPGSEKAEDSYTWGQPVLVRDFSRVLEARDGIPDHDRIGRLEDRDGPANRVQVDLDSGWVLLFAHLRRESVIVARGESVQAFTKVGSVGNSGMSTGPHLHLSAARRGGPDRGSPIRFEDVVVGLNAWDGDPWATHRDSWPVEEGFFFTHVER